MEIETTFQMYAVWNYLILLPLLLFVSQYRFTQRLFACWYII